MASPKKVVIGEIRFYVGRWHCTALYERRHLKVAAVKDWPLPETQKQVKSFVSFCSFYRKFSHHFADCSAPLTDLCRKSLPSV